MTHGFAALVTTAEPEARGSLSWRAIRHFGAIAAPDCLEANLYAATPLITSFLCDLFFSATPLSHLAMDYSESKNQLSADESALAALGYRQEFRRVRARFPDSPTPNADGTSQEFSMLSTIAFAFSIMGVAASVSSTLSFGLVASFFLGRLASTD